MQRSTSISARVAALVVFVVAMASLRLQFDASHAAIANSSVLQTLWAMAGYFTVLTNVVVAGTMAMVAMRWAIPAAVSLAVTVSIVMVGLVYHTMLASLFNPVGLAWWADQGLHSAVPLLSLLWWIIFAPRQGSFRAVTTALIWPAAYLLYAILRGSLTGFWPYPFLDVGNLGSARVAVNILAMVLAFAGVAAAMIAVKRRLV
ncbi:MAG: Pr6Pr family membrane protein [Paracoccaceae bacterium]